MVWWREAQTAGQCCCPWVSLGLFQARMDEGTCLSKAVFRRVPGLLGLRALQTVTE